MKSSEKKHYSPRIGPAEAGFSYQGLLMLLRAWLNGIAMFYETFICFHVSEAKPLCFSLCSQIFDDV